MQTLPYPGRFTWAVRSGRLVKPFQRFLPGAMRAMLDLLPDPASLRSPESFRRFHRPRAYGGRGSQLLAGCVQQVLDGDINLATIDVLTRNGVEVVIPEGQGCCGSLAWHIGEEQPSPGDGEGESRRVSVSTWTPS